jgi:hypothetical protein
MKLKFILLVLLMAAPVLAQDPARIQPARIEMDHLERLFPKAVQTIDVNVDQSLIRLASKFLKTDKQDEAAVREMLGMVHGVYVKGVEFDNDNEFSSDDVQRMRSQLNTPGWSRIVGVRSKQKGENVEVFLMHDTDLIKGIGVLIHDAKKLMVVNVVGPLDPEKISQLSGRFGIPNLDLDFGGAKKTTK